MEKLNIKFPEGLDTLPGILEVVQNPEKYADAVNELVALEKQVLEATKAYEREVAAAEAAREEMREFRAEALAAQNDAKEKLEEAQALRDEAVRLEKSAVNMSNRTGDTAREVDVREKAVAEKEKELENREAAVANLEEKKAEALQSKQKYDTMIADHKRKLTEMGMA